METVGSIVMAWPLLGPPQVIPDPILLSVICWVESLCYANLTYQFTPTGKS